MDLGTVDKTYTPDEPEFIHLVGHDDFPEYDSKNDPVGFYAVSAESDRAKKYAQAQLNKARKENNGKRKRKQSDDVEDIDLNDIVNIEAKQLAAIVTGWSGFWMNEKKGEALEFNEENLMLVLTHPKLSRYRKQLKVFTSNPLNYTKD